MTLFDFFQTHKKAALAFSGGVDSAYLLHAACSAGAEILPIFCKTPFQPDFELKAAREIAAGCGLPLTVLQPDVMGCETIVQNGPLRCYHCKSALLLAIKEAAQQAGFCCLLDGSNASDKEEERPGMRALCEQGVLSPLRLCGITKAQVRALSRKAGLASWDKAAYACLATRIERGTPITHALLQAVDAGEALLHGLGFYDFRLRAEKDGAARLELKDDQMGKAIAQKEEIVRGLSAHFLRVTLDLCARKGEVL